MIKLWNVLVIAEVTCSFMSNLENISILGRNKSIICIVKTYFLICIKNVDQNGLFSVNAFTCLLNYLWSV